MLKKLLSLLRNQVVLLLLVLLVLLLVVYLAWPLFGVAKVYRKTALLLTGASGLLLILVIAIPQAIDAIRRSRASVGSIGQELDRALLALAEECPGRGSLFKVERALRLPWVLVLGSPNSGKSTALAHANFARPFSDPQARTPLCTFWLGQGVVYVHPRARLRSDDTQWKGFLGWLAHQRRVESVLVQISATELQGRQSHEIEALAGQIQRRLWEVAQQVRPELPLQLMVAQCDRLDGFVRFFADLSDAERVAAWGLPMAEVRDSEVLGPLLLHGVAGLVSSLLSRVGVPFRRAGTGEDQAAVLAFPQEVARLGESMTRFVDALYPRGMGGGFPRLQEIFWVSARQEGLTIPGARNELTTEGQQIRLAPASAAPQVNIGAFFLRQPLLRLQQRALSASRPRIRWHLLALSGTAVLCLGISMLLGRGFHHHLDWLGKTATAVSALEALPPISRGSDVQLLLAELTKQDELRQLVCREASSEDQPSCLSEEPTRLAHERAVSYLTCRMGAQLVKPLATYDSSPQRPNELYTRLRELTTWRKRQRGSVLLRGFNALKATTLLQKHKPATDRCPQLTKEDERWLSSYLAEQWGHDREFGEPMLRNLGLFVRLHQQAEQPVLEFDQRRVDEARDNLRRVFGGPAGEGDAETLFYLSASELNLFSGDAVLSGPILKDAQKIPKVFTAAGCASFFRPNQQWDRWLGCVRGDAASAPGTTPSNRSSLSSYYLAAHQQAWMEWLNGLQQSKRIQPEDVVGAGDAILSLGKELKRIMLLIGRGPARKVDPKDKEPDGCQDARRSFGLFAFAAGEEVALDQDGGPVQQSFNQYQDALGKVGTVVKVLADWRPDPMVNSIKPAEDALQSLTELGRRREEFVTALQTAWSRQYQATDAESGDAVTQPLQVTGLRSVLSGFEDELREVIFAKLRSYLQGRWDGLYADWKSLLAKSPDDAANPELVAGLKTFVAEKLSPFVSGSLAPLYGADLMACKLKPTLLERKRQILCPDGCKKLAEARVLASKPMPTTAAPPPPPTPTTFLDPMVDIPECAGQPQEVWISGKELGQRFRCEASTGSCKPAGAVAGPASIITKRLPSGETNTLASGVELIPLLMAHKAEPVVRRGPRLQVVLRDRGNCQVRIYVDEAMLTPRKPVTPRGPVHPLATHHLPDRLVCP